MTVKTPIATYSLLGPRTTPPSEYDVVTTRLHYYVKRGFETDVPLRHWYERYQQCSPLQCADWDAFVEPQQTTYPVYTRSRKEAEIAIERVCAECEPADAERAPDAWTATLARTVPPLRYAFHGMHMIASYIGHMAPSGRITMAALFQSADELRRIERVAYRMRFMQESRARDFGLQSKDEWQSAPAWQPLREATELLLVAYDWGEALVGLNLCLKPVIDEVAVGCLLDDARRHADAYWTAVLERAYADCQWQRRWTVALVRLALAQNAANREVIVRWLELWGPRALLAAESLASLLPDASSAVQRARSLHAVHVSSALQQRDEPVP